MRSIAKLAMVATCVILCAYTQFTEAQPQTIVRPQPKGRLVLKPNIIAHPTKQSIPLSGDPPQLSSKDPCCVKRPPCCLQIWQWRIFVDNIEGIKNIVDLGIL